MKSEKEIKEYLAKVEKEYINCQKCNQKYLETVTSGIINALHWALDMPPFDYNRLDKYEEKQ